MGNDSRNRRKLKVREEIAVQWMRLLILQIVKKKVKKVRLFFYVKGPFRRCEFL